VCCLSSHGSCERAAGLTAGTSLLLRLLC
jgi:hypothetical protein